MPNQDEKRYETRGNYCESCLVVAGKELRKRRKNQAEWDAILAEQKRLLTEFREDVDNSTTV